MFAFNQASNSCVCLCVASEKAVEWGIIKQRMHQNEMNEYIINKSQNENIHLYHFRIWTIQNKYDADDNEDEDVGDDAEKTQTDILDRNG